MKPGWERALAELPPVPDAARGRVSAALQAELAQAAPRSWRRDGVQVFLGGVAVVALVGGALGLTGQLSVTADRLLPIGLLLLTAALGSYAAAAPARLWSRWSAVAASAATAAALVLSRVGHGHAASQPEWVCTVSHLAAGAPVVALLWRSLRFSAPSLLRALVGGLAVGTTGAVIGELGCGQGAAHVALFHLTAWFGLAAVAGLVGRRLPRSSYAP